MQVHLSGGIQYLPCVDVLVFQTVIFTAWVKHVATTFQHSCVFHKRNVYLIHLIG